MLKFFFHRFSFMVKLMEVLGVISLIFLSYKIFVFSENLLDQVLLSVVVAIYLFIRFCATRRWYPNPTSRYSGIELQFKKALVPTGYILTSFGLLAITFRPTLFLIAEIVLLTIIGHVNVILIHVHRKDDDTTPVNIFSGN